MRWSVLTGPQATGALDLVAIPLFTGEAQAAERERLEAISAGGYGRLRALGDLRGREGEQRLAYVEGALAPRIVWLGCGKAQAYEADRLRAAGARALELARELRLERLAFWIPASVQQRAGGLAAAAGALWAGASAAGYAFSAYKREDGEDDANEDEDEPAAAPYRLPSEVALLVDEAQQVGGLERERARAQALHAGSVTARDLGNLPANDAYPEAIVERARAVAAECGLRCEALGAEALERLGFGALLAVARGSARAPRLLVLEHAPPRCADTAPVVLVGKGVTFDTGGISIKPAKGLEEMKFDKCGAAAVIGAIEAAARLELPLRVVALAPLVENMPDGRAYRPGDIVRAYGGKHVEVISTDAEGRLILIDALAYAAERWRPRALVDLATLTGACMVALGDKYAGLFARDAALGEQLRAAGERSGERVWPLPVDRRYDKQLESPYADLKNVGGRGAGAVTAARFLAQFVPDDVAWAHVDIAGTAWRTEGGGIGGKGASGFGVRLLNEWLEALARGAQA